MAIVLRGMNAVGMATRLLGAGRDCVEDAFDPAMGVMLEKHLGDATAARKADRIDTMR